MSTQKNSKIPILYVNTKLKNKPFLPVIAYNFAKLNKIDLKIESKNLIEKTQMVYEDQTIEGDDSVTKKLFEMINFNCENPKNTKNEELISFSVTQLPDRKNLPSNCDVLIKKLGDETYINGKDISIIDLYIWNALNSNGRWNGLKKDKKYTKLSNYFDKIEKRPEIALAKSFFSQKPKNEKSKSVTKNKNYSSLNIGIDPKMKGRIVTRFPPEPSGFLHIGHVKAALLNSIVAEINEGKMIVRFDDTNPSKEKEQYTQSIIDDLKTLQITPWKITHTSDYFLLLQTVCEELLRAGWAFVEDTPRDRMKEERMERKDSRNRNNTIEQNLEMWRKMVNGQEKLIVRLKMDMKSNNGTLRDPTIYRCNDQPHIKTGDTFKVYPTYDFAIVIVDTVEGVTNAFRSNEYNDRGEQYKRVWNSVFKPSKSLNGSNVFSRAVSGAVSFGDSVDGVSTEEKPNFLSGANLNQIASDPLMPRVKTFSRVNFVHTILSKRKLAWFVETGRVSGWDDPRFPTVQGMLRQGLQVKALRSFIMEVGFSLNENLMEWDKIWSINKRILDPIVPRYNALEGDLIRLTLEDGPEMAARWARLHPKNSGMGDKVIRVGKEILLERVDAEFCNEGDEITLIEWGNVVLLKVDLEAGEMTGRLNLDGDVKKTMKVTWLADSGGDLVPIRLVRTAPLITTSRLEEEDLEKVANENSWNEIRAVGDPNLRNLNKGDVIQLQRKGFAIVDETIVNESKGEMVLIMIPDSKSKPMVVSKK